MQQSLNQPKLLVFDVNETLLDLQKLQQAIQNSFQDQHAFKIWFSTLLQYAMVESITSQHHSFAEIGKATLRMTAEKLGKHISDDSIASTISLITQLPPHPDVKNALAKFESNNFRIVALTNGSTDTVKKQMDYAQISEYFERLFSVEEVQSYKPQAKAYEYVLSELNIKAKDAMLIAAHPWDLAGGKAVGMQTAFIERPTQVYYPLLQAANYMVQDLQELFEVLNKR
ncbi:2-haloacid dehalogenase [Marivirga sericea]|uniref:2-haloacid dehalogenase n=1 Tax=Marivirga sericea TaxID=1028 RepID=A0A1X7IDR7_9BACT|nr:haloacid dehalogenase type II [Marivirga sericea]SMG12424.1 2-haloacid dehalogenase [Marivirga sericea]